MAKPSPGANRFKKWLRENHLTSASTSRAISDRGCQVQRWVCGDRQSLPWALLIKVSGISRIPLQKLATAKQAGVARAILRLAERDRKAA